FASWPLPVLQADRESLSLRHVWVDATAVGAAASVGDDTVLELLARGPLLPGLEGLDPEWDNYLATERARHSRCVEAAIATRLKEAATDATLARRLLQIDMSHERAWRALISAHLDAGEPSLALRAFKECEDALRRQLDISPSAETRRLIATVRDRADAQPAPPAQTGEPHRRPGARVAVVPPQIIGDGVPAYLAEAVAEILASSLARFRWLTVLSSFAIVPLIDAWRRGHKPVGDLDYLLDGLIRRGSDGRLSLTLRLIDVAGSGEINWSQRVDAAGEQPEQHLLEEVAENVVAAIDPAILLIEHRRATRAATASSYDYLMRAIPLLYRLQPETHRQAGELLRQAIATDPENATAYAWGALWANFQIDQHRMSPEQCAAEQEEAAQWAERAVLLDPDDALALTAAGHCRAYLRHQPDQGLVLHRRALAANPSLAWAWGYGAVAHCYLGEAEPAHRYLDRHRRLAPSGAQADFFRGVRALAYCIQGQWASAAEEASLMVQRFPFFMNTRKVLAAALGNLGREAEARAIVLPVLAVEPDFSIQTYIKRYPLQDLATRDAICRGLRRAGIGEDATEGGKQ
ncbi:MAG TPA: BTAD domain-containing putative transcriptional regulator, partial [Vineibacter sp.]|nr:BTAD domain-containing putative transcriptional regulator [Vineibacter sp.]